MASLLWRRHLIPHLRDSCFGFVPSSVSRRPILAWVMQEKSTAPSSGHLIGGHQGTLPMFLRRNVGLVTGVRFSHMSSLVERGAYDDRTHKHSKGSGVKKLELVSDGRLLSIEWDDGKVSKFHSLWLRCNCFCTQCKMDHTGQSKVQLDKVPPHSRLLSAVDDGEGCLVVQWKDDPGHTGIYPLNFLKANCYSRESLDHRRYSIRMKYSTDMVIPRVQYEDVLTSRRSMYKWMKALNETGITIVEGVPCQKGMVKEVCQTIASYLQPTAYGETFDMKIKPQPTSAGYTSYELKLHMDLPVYEATPGLQALHCIRFDSSITGGDNMFVDMFHAAEMFREKHPEEFDLLTRVPVTFQDIHYNREWPIHMRTQKTLFKTNMFGDLIGVVWHPYFMGPLQVPEEFVEPVYGALGKFCSLINNFPYKYQNRLKPGAMVIFNNKRLSHGRTAFDSNVGHRHLEGCYVEISEFKSCVHFLSITEGDGSLPIRVGDNDWQ